MKQLDQFRENIRLTRDEKQKMRDSLLAFVRTHPKIKEDEPERKYTFAEFFGVFGFGQYGSRFTYARAGLAFILIIFILGGGISYAAEGALPGDTLYPVKISVNEPVRMAVARGTKSKALVAAKLAVRRLEEAEALALEERLDPKTEENLLKQFDASVNSVENSSNELALKSEGHADAAEVSAALEVALQVHERVLSRIDGKLRALSENENRARVKDKVRSRITNVVKNRINVEAKVGASTKREATLSAEKRLKSAETSIIEAEKKYIEQKKEEITNELDVMSDAITKTELDAAKEKLIEGKTELEANNSAEAFMLFGDADRGAEEVKLKLQLKAKVR